jgi:hypothetical protein
MGSVLAQEESKPAKSAPGGVLATIGAYRFEVFLHTPSLLAFPRDSAGAPIDAPRLTGTAVFYHPNSPKPWFVRPVRCATAAVGEASQSLDLAIDLGTVPASGAEATLEIGSVPKPAQSTATFTIPVQFVKTPAETPALDRTPHDRSAPGHHQVPGQGCS